jgi:hypothetical protein
MSAAEKYASPPKTVMFVGSKPSPLSEDEIIEAKTCKLAIGALVIAAGTPSL